MNSVEKAEAKMKVAERALWESRYFLQPLIAAFADAKEKEARACLEFLKAQKEWRAAKEKPE